MNQIKQIFQTFSLVRQHDPSVVPLTAAAVGGTLAIFIALAVAIGPWWLWLLLGILTAVPVFLIVLGRKAQAASIAQIEGQVGAAAAVLQQMRGAWEISPAVAFNNKQDMVHLAVGTPGVVLVAEGSSAARVKSLLAKERRRFERAAGEIAVTEVVVGDGDGEVELGKLALHMAKLPREIKAKEVGPLARKLSALKASAPPMPKGPQHRRVPKKYR